ncbi:MAG TPA: DUF2933 domain-containing protein [Gaiellaceae bacterium]|nr:DUF2933 domain-containing protein [Gaiellaceae bacterium]
MLVATGLGTLIPILLVLACPLMMVWMMRGMHGHGGHSPADSKPRGQMSLEELTSERDALNAEIGNRTEPAKVPPQGISFNGHDTPGKETR